jgi:hypothetical protein
MIRILLPLFFSSILFLFSCSKKTELKDSVNPRPKIKLNSMNNTEYTQFKDSILIVISYEDGDGDLGFEDADKHSLFVKDSRLQKSDSYYVPPLAPPESNIPIKGELNIVLPPPFILSNAPSENVYFEIQLQDRAGNMSNLVVSPTVKIVR